MLTQSAKTFIGLIGLQTGTELITLALLFNKVTGLYGLLAILTGYSLSIFQLLTYVYAVVVLGLLAYLLPHVRRQSPLQCVSLAWLYAVDTVINAGCTAAFATHWFLGGEGDSKTAQAGSSGDGPHIGPTDTIASLVLIVLFTVVRVYLSLVVMAFAQQVLQRWGEQEGRDAKSSNPFAVGAAEGDGWKGRLGRALVSVGSGYWLEQRDEQETSWTRDMHSKFMVASPAAAAPAPSNEA
jgi:inositol phosphorylceramide synthase regulatory subunit